MEKNQKNEIREIWGKNAIRNVFESGWGVYGKVSYKIILSIINAFFFSIPLICKFGFIGIVPAVVVGISTQLIPIIGSFFSIFGCVWAILYTEGFPCIIAVRSNVYYDEEWTSAIIWIFEAIYIALFLTHIIVSIIKTKKAIKANNHKGMDNEAQ